MNCLNNYYLLNWQLFELITGKLNIDNNVIFRLMYLYCHLVVPHQPFPFSIPMWGGGVASVQILQTVARFILV